MVASIRAVSVIDEAETEFLQISESASTASAYQPQREACPVFGGSVKSYNFNATATLDRHCARRPIGDKSRDV
jgi:hypothetical protein